VGDPKAGVDTRARPILTRWECVSVLVGDNVRALYKLAKPMKNFRNQYKPNPPSPVSKGLQYQRGLGGKPDGTEVPKSQYKTILLFQ
jgi:hypothetical protein